MATSGNVRARNETVADPGCRGNRGSAGFSAKNRNPSAFKRVRLFRIIIENPRLLFIARKTTRSNKQMRVRNPDALGIRREFYHEN